MHKFRFQLLHRWIIQHYQPCRVADIGGGKGLLTHLLNESGFKSVTIDPFDQSLPTKYKDLNKIKHKLTADFSVSRINGVFEKEMAKDFDLLVGLHAHGSNMKIIEAAAEYHKSFILIPCCVIDEPIIKRPNVNWLESLIEYAQKLGMETERFELNFKGQDHGFCSKI